MLLVKCSVEIECRCCCWGKESGLGVIMVLLNEAVDGDWSQMKTLTRVLFPVRPLDVCDTDVFLKTNRGSGTCMQTLYMRVPTFQVKDSCSIKKKTKNKNNMCTKKGQNWSIFHLLSSLIWIFSSEKRQNPERSAWSSSSFGSNALVPQASGFKHAPSDVVSSSAAAGHQDTSPAISWTHLQALAPVVLTPALAHPPVLRSEFFFFLPTFYCTYVTFTCTLSSRAL